jgi:N-methylhydantoinase A
MTGLSSVDIRSIGAGGGSIAWIDSGGLLRVGPDSAGADPGPACYGRGGERPTVTDAALALGYIDPQYFLGGRMQLDPDAALRAVGSIGDSVGLSLPEAAHAIMVIAADHMVQSIQDITINEGVDPRDSLIVGGGGAAGLSILHIARELGCRRVLLPRTAAAFSACGGQYSDIVGDFWKSAHASTAEFPFTLVNEALGEIQEAIDQFQRLLQERGLQKFITEYFVEARYPHQVWELEVALAKGRFDDSEDVQELLTSFHDAHERVFTVRGSEHIECLVWKGRLAASIGRRPVAAANGHAASDSVYRSRPAYFSRLGEVDTPIHLGASLAPGDFVEGPGIIEEPTTTLVVYPDCRITVTDSGNYMAEIGWSSSEASSPQWKIREVSGGVSNEGPE